MTTVELDDLPGCFVVEIGIRQAWPFLGFCDNRAGREARLYLDAAWSVQTPNGGQVEPDLAGLDELNGATVGSVQDDSTGLRLTFDSGEVFVVSSEPNADTIGEPWWFSPWAS